MQKKPLNPITLQNDTTNLILEDHLATTQNIDVFETRLFEKKEEEEAEAEKKTRHFSTTK